MMFGSRRVGFDFRFKFEVLAFLAVVGLLAIASPASAAEPEFGVEQFVSATCKDTTCAEPFTQAAAHPNFGLTLFKLKSAGNEGEEVPVGGIAKNLRVDIPAGLTVNPQAVPYCSEAEFDGGVAAELPAYTEPKCSPDTILGVNKVRVVVEPVPGHFVDVTLEGHVYNLVQPPGVPAEFGAAISLEPLGLPGVYSHTLLEGGVSWHKEEGLDKQIIPTSGDYHDIFKIHNIGESPPLLESTLIYDGQAGHGFLTVPSTCTGPMTSYIEVEANTGAVAKSSFTTPVGPSGCSEVPFAPSIKVEPSTTAPDLPDAAKMIVSVPQNEDAAAINSSSLKTAEITMPEGMTLNPSAANGLVACTDAQFAKGVGSSSCPAESKIGTVKLEVPTLPAGSLSGSVYVGQPIAGASPSSGHEYRIFVVAESTRYGVEVQLEGKVVVNESTGRVKTIIDENPQAPFSSFILELGNGAHTPLANPILCGNATTSASLAPYTGLPAALPTDAFAVACSGNVPFSGITQATSAAPTTAGSNTSFTFTLNRPDGRQYLSTVSTTLPDGLLAKIPSVPLCGEAQANAGACPAASQIGKVSVSVGSGGSPYVLVGTVYLTGPYGPQPGPFGGAPYGLSIVVPAEKVGPYNYGQIVTRAAINVDHYTGRVSISSQLPTIVGGVPLRMKSLTVSVTHPNFMFNPTSCATLSTDTALTSTFGAGASVSTPFAVSGCGSLAFKPQFSAYTNAKTSRAHGASLRVLLKETAGNANIKSVATTLPLKMPSRNSTLKQACPEAQFNRNPYGCPGGSWVGGVSATTPALPGKLTGPVFMVSHGGAAFPDLDLVVKGDGVTMILVGNTNISKGITHTTFATLPDVPVSSFELNLPTGPHSALAANGSFCKHKMYLPMSIVGQNGKTVKQKTRIHVAGCPVRVIGHRRHGRSATITVVTPSAGRLSTSGKDLRVTHKRVGKAGVAKIKVKLSRRGERMMASRRLRIRVKVSFRPANHSEHASKAFVRLRF